VSGLPQGACPHDACDGSGFLIDEATNTARDCTCRPVRRSQVKARRLEARLPRRYQHVAFEREPVVHMPDTVVREVRRFTREIDRNLDQGRGIWFVGDVGTGKTTLAMLGGDLLPPAPARRPARVDVERGGPAAPRR
jgi:DNA replication protein DnaC